MDKPKLIVFDYENLNEETKRELKKVSDYLVELIYVNHHYHNGIIFLKVLAEKLEKLGIKSDIYYKIASVQNILDNKKLSGTRNTLNCQIFDIYLECMYHKDYRNAMRMLKIYQKSNNTDFIKMHLAGLYTKICQLDQAEVLLEGVEVTQSENPFYYSTLLELLYKRREYERVIELFPIVEKYDGYTKFVSYLTIGKSYLRMGKEEEAVKMFCIASKIKKDDSFNNSFLNKVKKEIEDEDTRPHPSIKQSFISYQIAMDEKDYDKAIMHLERVIELSEDRFYISKNRKRLKDLKVLAKKNND